MSAECVPKCSTEGGNINPPQPEEKKRINPAKRWVFTLNNYTNEEYCSICSTIKTYCRYALVAKEVGDKGTPHLQGYIELKHKSRPKTVFKFTNRIWWSNARGDRLSQNIYIKKEDDDVFEWSPDKPKTISNLSSFQQFVWDYSMTEPNDREILWVYGGKNLGKSKILKKLCAEGKSWLLPMSKGHALSQVYKSHEDIHCYCFNLTADESAKQTTDFFSILESVKDGLFSSAFGTKTNGMCCFNDKHVIVMANCPPDWSLTEIDKDRFLLYEVNKDLTLSKNEYEFIDEH
jgi:hypothetical protein